MSLIHTLIPFWLLLLFGTIITILFNAGTVAVCILTRVKFKKIAVFYGKPVITLQTRFGPVCFGYIPMGGFIELDMDTFPFEHRLKRAAVALSGPLALLLSSLLCLGLQRAGDSFAATYPQVFELVLSPMTKGREFFALFSALAQPHPITGYGVLAAKAGMLNLLPLPTLAGGRVLVEMASKREASSVAKALKYLGSLTAFCMLTWFLVLLVRHFMHSQGKG